MTAPLQLLSSQKPISIRNAYTALQQVRVFDPPSNTWIPWTGGGDMRVRFSTKSDGYNADGTPSTLLGPFTMAASGLAGWYYANITADQLTASLASLVGQIIYQVVEGAYGTSYYNLTDVQPLLVIDPRAPIPAEFNE